MAVSRGPALLLQCNSCFTQIDVHTDIDWETADRIDLTMKPIDRKLLESWQTCHLGPFSVVALLMP